MMPSSSVSQLETDDMSQKADQRQLWTHIHVEHLQNPPGEGSCHFEDEHAVFVSLASRPIRYVQSQDGKTFNGLYRPGDTLITPANVPLTVGWEGEENCVQIRLTDAFLRKVARETLRQDCDRFTLLPEFRAQNSQIEAVARMLLKEAQQDTDALGTQLYVDSLANVLAISLLRHHVTTNPQIPLYEGGLPPRQLQHVLDYMDAHLDQNLKLENLAELLGVSQFHFSRLFKQSIGLSPYQYLIQQRVERAKQLLKQTNHPITEIAFRCGFNSHSHLSKQFRQVTGITPRAYRTR